MLESKLGKLPRACHAISMLIYGGFAMGIGDLNEVVNSFPPRVKNSVVLPMEAKFLWRNRATGLQLDVE